MSFSNDTNETEENGETSIKTFSGKNLQAESNSPVPLGVLAVCGLALVIAGGIMGNAGKLFSYVSTFRPGYVRESAPGEEQGPPPKEAMEVYMARGAKVFAAKCIACHGPEAKGDGNLYPSLVGSAWANGETERFAMIVLNGLEGPTSEGKSYGIMTPQGIGMTAEELAGIMTYVRNHFGNTKGDVVTVDMAKAAMKISAERKNAGKSMTAGELAEHISELPGHGVDPKSLVDPVTLAPMGKKK